MNKFIESFIAKLNGEGIRYCHWKSVNTLDDALNGIGDLDLLIDLKDEGRFSAVAASFGFKLCMDNHSVNNRFVYHYYALDPATGILVHLHIYFRLITGGAILKNHHIQLEDLFLTETQQYKDFLPIPKREADLILFVVRKMIEQYSFVEHVLFMKSRGHVNDELSWLSEDYDKEIVESYLRKWLPQIPVPLFWECYDALKDGASSWRRLSLGKKVHSCFPYAVNPLLKTVYARNKRFLDLYIRGKLRLPKPKRTMFPGGKFIAFVGSDASGKSTLSAQAASDLNKTFKVEHIHLGKPPRVWYVKCLWLVYRLYAMAKRFNSSKTTLLSTKVKPKKVHPVIAWMNALNRSALLKRAISASLNGTIVISDRFPTSVHGQPDGPCIESDSFWGRLLKKHEQYLYEKMAKPDIYIRVMAPLEVTKERNANREDTEPEDMLVERYQLVKNMKFPHGAHVHEIDTTASIEDCLTKVRKLIWSGI